jgi:hypothetical protein
MKLQNYKKAAIAVGGAFLLTASTASSQQEQDPPQLDGQTAFAGTLGQSRGGIFNRFDPQWNPAMGLILDGYGMLAGGGDGLAEGYDNIGLRSMEMTFSSRIDPLAWGYAALEIAPHEGSYEFELAEAAIWADQLPHSMSLRAGRFLADFGKWNSIHQHDRPHPFSQGVQQEYLGGALALDGLELHQWGGIGDVPVRWSVGVAARFEGHGHSLLAAEEEGEGDEHDHAEGIGTSSVGGLGLNGFAYTGRVSAQHDVGQNGYFQWGASLFLTPEGLTEEHDESGTVERFELGQSTFALDFTYRNVDASGQSADTLGVELYWNQRDHVDEITEQVEAHDAVGMWGFYEHAFSPYWAAGLEGSWWEHAGKENGGSWLSGEDAGRQAAVFASWNPSELQRIRLIVGINQPIPEAELDHLLAVQWQVILGSHTHALDW